MGMARSRHSSPTDDKNHDDDMYMNMALYDDDNSNVTWAGPVILKSNQR